MTREYGGCDSWSGAQNALDQAGLRIKDADVPHNGDCKAFALAMTIKEQQQAECQAAPCFKRNEPTPPNPGRPARGQTAALQPLPPGRSSTSGGCPRSATLFSSSSSLFFLSLIHI